MAFPVVESVTETTDNGDTDTFVMNLPATVDSGDLLIAIPNMDSSSINKNFSSLPSGWTSLTNEFSAQSQDINISNIMAKRADGTEGGGTISFTITSASGTQRWAGQVYRISGWFGTISTGVDIAVTENSSGTTPDPPSLNPSSWDVEDTLWIAGCISGDDSVGITSYSAGYSNGVNTGSTGGFGVDAQVNTARRNNAAASENPGSFTLPLTQYWASFTIAIRPAAAAGLNAMTLLGVGI